QHHHEECHLSKTIANLKRYDRLKLANALCFYFLPQTGHKNTTRDKKCPSVGEFVHEDVDRVAEKIITLVIDNYATAILRSVQHRFVPADRAAGACGEHEFDRAYCPQ